MTARLASVRPGGLPLCSSTRPQFFPPPPTTTTAIAHERRPKIFSHLHTSRCLRASAANHYETLGLDAGASQAEVKKKYYQLSKTTHPDRNRSDPNAAARFSAVSEAYATLGNAEKRARYDRDVMRSRGAAGVGGAGGRGGSYSSAQAGPNGARPASGLSKRRSAFRGPPPSFYKAGGYGAYGGRASQAEANAENARRQAGNDYDGGWTGDSTTAGGFSPGQGAQRGFDNDVPHFDRDGHYRTQENITGRTAGRKRRVYREHVEMESAAGMGAAPSFVFIGSVIGLAVVIPAWFLSRDRPRQQKSEK